MKESLSGPVLANRSDGIKPGIGIERKNEPTIDLENGEIKVYFTFFFSPFSVAPKKTYILGIRNYIKATICTVLTVS